MKKKRGILILSIIMAILMIAVGVYAYYEYYGKYSALIHINGVIRLDAFGAFDDDYRGTQYGYGTTPENPFIVDNKVRMNNLIVLNNDGKLMDAKEVYGGAQKFYFAFDFTEQETPQILDMTGVVQSSVGNNEYPFVDDLTGLLYAHLVSGSEYVYLSAGGSVDITKVGSAIFINGEGVTLLSGTVTAGEYIKVPDFYLDTYTSLAANCITTSEGAYVPANLLLPVPQIVANSTVKPPDNQIDVGFFNCIGRDYEVTLDGYGNPVVNESVIINRGYVHDVILHNVTIDCTETQPNKIRAAIDAIWATIMAGVPRHNFADIDNQTDERHIGLFAGHIDGSAKNITLSGDGIIKINGAFVNSYSRFTTVGFIDDRALINGILFSELTSSGTGIGMLTGSLFADSIYDLAQHQPNVYKYPLSPIPGAQNIWSGITTTVQSGIDINHFSQGIFRFVLSEGNDVVNNIWQGRGNVNLLNKEGFNVTKSVLFCSNEYRYSETQQGGGSIMPTGASSNETRYGGISTLTPSSSILDKGKYIITAKVYDSTEGIDKYYALKIVANISQGGTIEYVFDESVKVDVSDYINNTGGQTGIYSSCIWQTAADSSTPTFQNTRFKSEFLSLDIVPSMNLKLTSDSAQAIPFSVSVLNSTFSYTVTEQSGGGYVSVRYYLNFNPITLTYYFSTERDTAIEIYQISNGFRLELVDAFSDITVNDDYIIVARDSSSNYLIGAGTTQGAGGSVVVDGSFAPDLDLSSIPSNWNINEYQAYRRYVWNATTASSGLVAFREKLSATYYLGYSGTSLALTTQANNWTYTQNAGAGGRLGIISRYLSYAYNPIATGFSLSSGQYTVYIYKLVPDDVEPDYNTYQGAKLITSESSTVQAGQYMIAVNTGSTYQAVIMTGAGAGALNKVDITAYVNGTAEREPLLENGTNSGYKWRVNTTSSTPSLQNVKYTASYLSRNAGNTALAPSATEKQWMYNAVSGRLYYTNAGEDYYLAYTGSAFAITKGSSTPAHIYDFHLYKVDYQYIYSNVVPVQAISYTDSTYRQVYNNNPSTADLKNNSPAYAQGAKKIYFVLTAPLTNMATTAPYVLGSSGTVDQSSVESLNLVNTSSYSSVNKTFTTTSDLASYRWRLDTKGDTATSTYIAGHQFRNDKTGMYLAASTGLNSRTLVVAKTPNINRNGSTQITDGSLPPTGIGLGATSKSYSGVQSLYRTTTTGGVTTYIGNSFYIMGSANNYEYYLWKALSPGVFTLSLNTSRTNPSTPVPTEYSLPYLYEASGFTTNVLITEMREIGDNLDPDMHYMITALVQNPDTTISYYAISESLDEFSNKVLKGTNVTSQATTINNSPGSSTDMLIMVPVEADWYQTSSEKTLNFYQDYYSTNAIRDYLTVSGTNVGITSFDVTSGNQPTDWYYDAISKYFIYSDGSSTYYLTYNHMTDSVSLTLNKSSATHINIYRFKPTYIVTRVENALDDSLKEGNFIIAGRDAEGYIALGLNDSGTDLLVANVSEYIKDKLTETEYMEIQNYIWKQQYYDFYSTPYNPVSDTQYIQLFSYKTGGGFTPTYSTTGTGMEPSSDPMTWKITNSNGLWTFINNRQNGLVSVNSRGITFTGDSSRLTVADSGKTIDRYISSGFGYSFNVSGYSVMLCNTSGTPVTAPVSGSSYLLIARSGSTNYVAVKNSSGTISLVNYDSNTYQDTGCLWVATENVGGWTFENGTYYISTDNSSEITASTTGSGIWTVNSSTGATAFSSYTFPSYTGSALQMTTNSAILAPKLYVYSTSGGNKLLTPTTAVAGNNRVIVFNNGNDYWAAYIEAYSDSVTTIPLANITVGQNGVLTTTTTIDELGIFTATVSGGGFKLARLTRYLYSNGTTLTNVTSSNQATVWSFDTNLYMYYSQATTYTPYVTTTQNASISSGIPVYLYKYNGSPGSYTAVTGDIVGSGVYAMLVYDNSAYYVIGQSGSLLTRAFIGSTLQTGWESNIVAADHHITAINGAVGHYMQIGTRYLTISGDSMLLSGSQTTQWEYNYAGQYGVDSRFYNVNMLNLSAQYLTVGVTNRIETTSAVTDVVLYQADLVGQNYTLTIRKTNSMPTSGNYVIVVYKEGSYYAVRYSQGQVIAYNLGSTVLAENIISDLVWTADASGLKMTVDSGTYYLRRNNDGLYLKASAGATWVYSYTDVANGFTAKNSSTTPLHIFRVDRSSELDDVTDIISMLSGKAKLTESISLLESGNYVIVAEVDENNNGITDKYYSLGVVDIFNSQAIDVTDLMNLSLGFSSSYITFFDAGVWQNKGSELNLIFKNQGFADSYYLTGALSNMDAMTPQIKLIDELNPPDLTKYTWKTYTFNISGNTTYLLGYADASTGPEIIYYMYFDSVTLQFKLTTDYLTAASSLGKVQLYQLAAETPVQPVFQSLIIEVASDNQTILSYPITLVESQEDLVKYVEIPTQQGLESTGEYLITAVNGDNYYALTLSELKNLSYVDVYPYFSGNYSIDVDDNYCISVNKEYIWRQILQPSVGLNFINSAFQSEYLYTANNQFTYDIASRQLSDGTYYITFTVEGGFAISSYPSSMPIYLYLLGESGVEIGSDDDDLSYTYYTQPLTTIAGSVDFSKFRFKKTLIPELKRYGIDYNGNIGSKPGWPLYEIEQILQTASSSVFFSTGITATEDVAALATEFIPMTHSTTYVDGVGASNEVTLTYYAPAGSSSFVIDEASPETPVFVNVIATTEFDQTYLNKEFLRYLALWKIGDIDLALGQVTTLKTFGDGSNTAANFAHTFIEGRQTPKAAIPLPNRYGSPTSGASYAKVDGEEYTLSNPQYGEEYYIAHTYVIIEPGVYYLGASYGSVGIAFLSVDNRALEEEGEASGMGSDSQFSIDFCYGDIDGTATGVVMNEALGNLAYVGSPQWYQSNIYPQFIQGTPLHPNDYIMLKVNRTKSTIDATSSVNFTAYTKAALAPGILYVNDNTAAQRQIRKVDFKVYSSGLAATTYTGTGDKTWNVHINADDTLTISAKELVESVEKKYYLNIVQQAFLGILQLDQPILSTVSKYNGTCVDGYLATQDGRYLVKTPSGYALSYSLSNAVRLYSTDGTLTPILEPIDNEEYLLIAFDGVTNKCVTIDLTK